MLTHQEVLQLAYDHVIQQAEPSCYFDGMCSYYLKKDEKTLLCGAAPFLINPEATESNKTRFCNAFDSLPLEEIRFQYHQFINFIASVIQRSHDAAAKDFIRYSGNFISIYKNVLNKNIDQWNEKNPNNLVVMPGENSL